MSLKETFLYNVFYNEYRDIFCTVFTCTKHANGLKSERSGSSVLSVEKYFVHLPGK